MQRSGPRCEPQGPGRRNLIQSRVPWRLGSSTRRVRAPGCRRLLENPREAHLSAAPHKPPPYPWLPRTYEDGQRSSRDQQPPPQGALAPGRHGLQEVSRQGVPSGASGPAGKQRSMRFTPSDRLRKRFEFRRLRDVARRVHTRSFVLLIARSEQPRSRLGITVSRQVGNAVRRNRVKRLLREAFRQQRSLFPEACDLVVIAKAGSSATLTLAEVSRELEQASGALRSAWANVRSPDGRPRGSAPRPTKSSRTAGRGPSTGEHRKDGARS
jgi:ribonuclease P protein component